MKLLITGAAGVLGQALIPLLEARGGYDLRLTDMVPLETPHEFVQADLTCWEEAQPLCQGVDQVLHIAAIHPWKQYTDDQYLDCNIKGTHHLVRAAAEAGVKRLLYTSSIAAMGYEPLPGFPSPFDESKPCFPNDHIYSVSKHVGEQFCHMYHRSHGLPWVFLRPGCFIPIDESEPGFGLGLLGSRVSFADIASGHFKALLSDVVQEAIILCAGAPFTAEDSDALLTDARSAILKYYPEAAKLEEQGLDLPTRLCPTYRIDQARRLLGYEPEWTFDRWLRERLAS